MITKLILKTLSDILACDRETMNVIYTVNQAI